MLKASLGRRRARHARRSRREEQLDRRGRPRRSARRRPPSARTRSISKSWSSAPATSRCRSSATRTATSCTCSSATARSSAATRRSSSARRRPISTDERSAGAVRGGAQDRPRHRLCRRRHRRVPDGCRHRQVLLHRGQSAHPGRAHGDRGGDRHRHRQGADPHRRGRRASARRRDRRAGAGGDPAQRPRAAVPHHDRGSREQLHPGLRPHHRLSRRHRLRHPRSTAAPPIPARSSRRYYDPLLEKVTAWAPTPEEAIARMDRALREFRIRGVATNLAFLEAIITHPDFRGRRLHDPLHRHDAGAVPARSSASDRATKLLTYIADVTVNGHPETRGRARPPQPMRARPSRRRFTGRAGRIAAPSSCSTSSARRPSRDWMREQKRVLVTDTTMRDAPPVAARHAHAHLRHRRASPAPMRAACRSCFSLECWGGATFDVAMRFLTEDPWERLALLRERVPNILLQMLLRGANGVGYTNYPDNVVRYFVAPGGRGRHGPLPRLRLPELGREHARRDGRGARGRQALRGGDLLHRRHPRSRRGQVRPEILCRPGQGAGGGGLPHPGASRTWPGC